MWSLIEGNRKTRERERERERGRRNLQLGDKSLDEGKISPTTVSQLRAQERKPGSWVDLSTSQMSPLNTIITTYSSGFCCVSWQLTPTTDIDRSVRDWCVYVCARMSLRDIMQNTQTTLHRQMGAPHTHTFTHIPSSPTHAHTMTCSDREKISQVDK